jgi:Fe-S cluster biogenesis protein NfuA/nitrite reductase/ring-hydroxylating ferredoxin subunit
MSEADAATVERLLEDVEAIADAEARERALAALQGLVDLYGTGLERIVAVLSARDDAAELADALAADDLVSHLLLLHDLHPVPVEQRVYGALDEVRPYLDSHGGDVELVAIEDGVVRLRMTGSCDGCAASRVTLRLAIEDAIRKAAPEMEAVEAESVDGQDGAPEGPTWATIDADGLGDGDSTLRKVDGEPILVLHVGRRLYAYRPDCAACGASLAGAQPRDRWIDCPDCGTRYDVRRAGRAADRDGVQLDPVPLLQNAGGPVRVALGAPA